MSLCDHDDLTSDYAAHVEALRSAARWLLAASAGVGVLLVAGLQLTGIGQLPPDSWRLWAALGTVVVTLAATAYVVKSASTVLTQEWLTLADFTSNATGMPSSRATDRSRKIEYHLNTFHQELFGHAATTIAELHRNLRRCHESMHGTGRRNNSARQRAMEQSRELRKAARDVVQAANYYYVLHLFNGLRTRIAWAAAIVLVSVAVFTYAVDQPRSSPPIEVRIVPIATQTGAKTSVEWPESRLSNIRNLS